MRLKTILAQNERIVAGIMSGTSVDGVDAVIARLGGTGTEMEIELLGYASRPYRQELRDLVLSNSEVTGASARDISQLNAALPHVFADAVVDAVDDSGLPPDRLDLVGCHGQTIHHVPIPSSVGGLSVRSTLQLGDASVLANLLGVTVVGDFRNADMALGGQGAPLVPYFDFVRFRDATESRVLLNLGGIANVTILPAGCDATQIVAFDTGPANMVIDALVSRLFHIPFDQGGSIAGSAPPDAELLAELLKDNYFSLKPPKSTGREQFGTEYVANLIAHFSRLHGEEASWTDNLKAILISTATSLTSKSVAMSVARLGPVSAPHRVIVAGGGTRNQTLMAQLGAEFKTTVEPIESHGIGSTQKEALCFAVLAHELVNGTPTGLPSVTGASRPALLGKISVPS